MNLQHSPSPQEIRDGHQPANILSLCKASSESASYNDSPESVHAQTTHDPVNRNFDTEQSEHAEPHPLSITEDLALPRSHTAPASTTLSSSTLLEQLINPTPVFMSPTHSTAAASLSSSSSSSSPCSSDNEPQSTAPTPVMRDRTPEVSSSLENPASDVRSTALSFREKLPPHMQQGIAGATEPSPDPSANADVPVAACSTPTPTARRFLHHFLGTDPDLDGSLDEELDEACRIAPKRRGIYNFVQVPTRLERLLVLCVCICADEFLFLFTVLPIRCLVGFVREFLALLMSVTKARRLREYRTLRPTIGKPTHDRRSQTLVTTFIDLMHLSILLLTSLFLSLFDISWVYHSIRAQSFIKLYVVFNVMEIFDRLCCSFGVDILDSLGWTTATAVSFYFSNPKPSPHALRRQSESFGLSYFRARALRGLSLLTRVIFDYLITLVYVCLHASLLLAWVVTLNVAINTQNNALLTLLVSNNFVELKGAVFKSFKVQNLFQLACSDGVERFQLTVFLCVMLGYAEGNMRLLLTWLTVFSCEVVVDWIKHAFVTKFNRIPHRAYQQFAIAICQDMVGIKKNSVVRSIGGSSVSKRIGFVSLPLAALTLRMASHGLIEAPYTVTFLLFSVMLIIKASLSIGLLGYAIRRSKRDVRSGEQTSGVDEDDEVWIKSLAQIGRYDKF